MPTKSRLFSAYTEQRQHKIGMRTPSNADLTMKTFNVAARIHFEYTYDHYNFFTSFFHFSVNTFYEQNLLLFLNNSLPE